MRHLKIVMAEYHTWDSAIQIGSHKYGAGFLNGGHELLWIPSFWHILSCRSRIAKRPASERWMSLQGKSIRFDNGPEQYSPFTLLPHRKSPSALAHPLVLKSMLRATIPSFPKWLRTHDWDRPDVLWITNTYLSYATNFIKPKVLIYRMADDLASFDNATKAVIDAELEVVEKADLVLVTSRELVKKVQSMGKEPIYLPNGVTPESFKRRDLTEPKDLAAIHHPRVIYIGAIDHWFDFELVKEAASLRSDVNFVIIGPCVADPQGLDSLPNVKMLGPRPYSTIPGYLTHSDAAIMPFKKTRLTDNINPVKLYEYFASGRPVVMTDLAESRNMNPPAIFATSPKEFIDGLKKAFELGPDRPEFLDFARNNSWDNRCQQVRDAISNLL